MPDVADGTTHSPTNQPALVIYRTIEVDGQAHRICETVTTEALLSLISDLAGDTLRSDSASIHAWHLLEKLGRR